MSIRTRNNVTVTGRGTQPMMLAHGFGCDQNMWRFITPAFENDYRLVLFDYVGSGKSDWSAYDPRRYNTLDGYARDVLEICAEMDLQNVVFVGHSVSCMVGVLAANADPGRFAELIMIGPSPCYINEGDYVGGFGRADIEALLDMMERNYLGWASFLTPVIMKNADRPELAQELEASFCSTDPEIARRFAEATFFADNRADLRSLQVPSLVMQCSEDAIAPLSVGDYLSAHLPQSTLRVMQATGHCPHMSHPTETIRVMKQYLDGKYARTPPADLR